MSTRMHSQNTKNGMDEHLRALSHRHRRFVLAHLRSSVTPMALADLTDAVVRWETDQSPTAVPTTRDRIATDLYHIHLPHLDDAGLVAFEPDTRLVSLGGDADAVAPFLEAVTAFSAESGEGGRDD